MANIILDGRRMRTIQGAHEELCAKLRLPAYYDRNLDALWKALSTWREPIDVRLVHGEDMLNALESYGASLLRVFFDACAENENVNFTLSGDGE